MVTVIQNVGWISCCVNHYIKLELSINMNVILMGNGITFLAKVLRKLRHPVRSKKLRSFIDQ